MNPTDKTLLVFGALLHDIGKVVQRSTQERRSHAEIGYEFMKKLKAPQEVLDQVRYHHIQQLRSAKLPSNSLAYITYYADNISSGTDRRTLDGSDTVKNPYNFDTWTNQADVFNHFGETTGDKYYPPTMLDDRKIFHFADEKYRPYNHSDYTSIVHKIKETIQAMAYTDEYETSMLNLLESTTSFVPSSTHREQARDISLYDHSKLTAAIALCIYEYFTALQRDDFDTLQAYDNPFDEELSFLMLTYDISGIQNFIYTIRDKQAAKMLRSRSFYLEMLAENINHQLIRRLHLSRANLLYSGGGGAYIMAPNTPQVLQSIEEVEVEINRFLRKTYGADLYVAFACTPFSANTIKSHDGQMNQVYRQLGRKISHNKLNRYSADQILELNAYGKKVGRECNICHRVSEHSDSSTCSVCEGLINFSNYLQHKDLFEVNSQPNNLPLGFDEYLHPITDQDVLNQDVTGRVYSKNKFYTGKYQATHLWVGDYTDTDAPTFNDYLNPDLGIQRLGVVRCDVDNLGNAFISGFSDHFKSLSRTATLSRSLALFFQYYINLIMEENEITGSIIYAGGDDVFVVGHWADMIKFAIELRQKFVAFTQNKLTLSTGIGMFHGKTPISIMAKQTGELESAAKSKYDDKDAITLFHPDHTFKWDTFIHNIWNDKYQLISNFMLHAKFDHAFGKAFLYRLLELIRASFIESSELDANTPRGTYKTISWARWVYYLSRMEPKEREAKIHFREFAQQLHQYFMNEDDVKELELAIILYIYSIRGETNDNVK